MVANINGLPVFDAVMLDDATGMLRISLVDDPAVMSLWQSFDNKPKALKYAVTSEEKRLVRGVVMRADFPIYRYDEQGEYYIMYRPETIRTMAEKYLAEGRQNLVNLMHEEGTDVEGVQMVQYFIKGDGVSVEGFDDIADGSLFAEFHVTNDEVWAAIKAGTYKGFSLEGIFNVVPDNRPEEVEEIAEALDGLFSKITKHFKSNMSKVNRLKKAIAKLLSMEFGNVTTDKGILSWETDEDLKADDAIFVEDENGESVPAPDGEYVTTDNKVIVVSDGKVVEIADPDAEVAPEEPAEEPKQEEPAEQNPAESAEMPSDETSPESDPVEPSEEENPAESKSDENKDLEAKVAELEEENAALKAENEALKAQLEELKKMSAAKPAHEEVTTTAPAPAKTGNRGLDRLARYMTAQ